MVNLFVCTYTEPNLQRAEELQECLNRNIALKDVHVHILHDDPKRHTYVELFEYANSKIQDVSDVSIIANSDIYFDDTSIALIDAHLAFNECYALTRWDVQVQGDPVFLDRRDSQDSWCFRGRIRNIPASFTTGIPGCDNCLAMILHQAGYILKNPSCTIKSYHLHLTQIKSYGDSDRLPPPYLRVNPVEL